MGAAEGGLHANSHSVGRQFACSCFSFFIFLLSYLYALVNHTRGIVVACTDY